MVVPVEAQEEEQGATAEALAETNALAKVRGAVLPEDTPAGSFVLGTDTVVEIDGRVLGKPRTAVEASRMLTSLSGKTHKVVSGVALRRQGGKGGSDVLVAHAVTEVTFLPLEPEAIAAYVSSREWIGKAGGYAVQGLAALFVSRIVGEYSNVVGLPLCLLAVMFRRAGFDLLERRWVDPSGL